MYNIMKYNNCKNLRLIIFDRFFSFFKLNYSIIHELVVTKIYIGCFMCFWLILIYMIE
jgi:hypothetical protein